MVNRKTASALKLAALPLAVLLTGISTQSVAARLTSTLAPIVAQAPSFPVPDSVAKGTEVQVSSSSDNMNSITGALKDGFESEYSNAKVSVETKEADAALQDVLSGNADLAAISRPLTDAEKAQNLIDVAARREKIAIIVGNNNPFAQSITGSQFAQIFRGEITNWQEIGGPDKPIRFIDRPETSETRQALNPYPVFVSQPFETGSNATQVSEDSLEAIAEELGDDGISYALVGQLEGQSDVKAIKLHQTLPDDPRYPFSQPYSFVYAGAASPAVKAFLGYATGAPGQAALSNADLSGYAVSPAAGSATAGDGSGTTTTGADGNAAGTGDATAGANGDAATDAEGSTANGSTIDPATGNSIAADGTVTDADGNVVIVEEGDVAADGEIEGAAADADGAAGGLAGRGRWWWLLLPLAGLALLIWAASKRGAEEETGYIANADRDDAVRTNYRGAAGVGGDKAYATSEVGSKVGARVNRAAAGSAALAGGAAAAGAGLASRAGKGASKTAGDVTMDLDGIKGSTQTGIDSVKGSVSSSTSSTQGGLGNLRSNIQGGVDSARSNIQGGIDSARSNIQSGAGNLQSNVQGKMDSAKGGFQGSVDGIKNRTQDGIGNLKGGIDNAKGSAQSGIEGARTNMQGSIQSGVDGIGERARGSFDDTKRNASETGSNWLDRAKQRINEAADQAKDKANDIKDDMTGNS